MPRPAVAAPKAAPAASIPAAKPATPVASPPRTRPGDDRFIVEGEKAPPTASAPPKPTAAKPAATARHFVQVRSEEPTSELQSLMRISYTVFCLQKKKNHTSTTS